MSFNTDEYIDVAARISLFADKYPEGSLQGDGYFVRDVEDKIIGYHYKASAYRTPSDERPGVGTAYEPIPGKTNFTRDSEVMNAETSAWGRAIVALGFNTKKIASAEEVRNRQPDGAGTTAKEPVPAEEAAAVLVAESSPASSGSFPLPGAVQAELDQKQARSVPTDGGVPEEVVMPFGKHAGKKMGELVDSAVGYVKWLASDAFEPKNADQRRVKGAAITVLGGSAPLVDDPDDGIPF